MMDFLYFPEDKTLYIPAILTLIIFMIGAYMFYRWIIKVSSKEEQSFNERFSNEGQNDQHNQEINSKEH
ncbi:hypothetical protein [Alkalibacillus silvisoli]|uniref:Uncharacterized protein n=1 Tax=Alkalibacillus silvisoli TaxID=392823 RepID=A0ABP3JUW5_9BACI